MLKEVEYKELVENDYNPRKRFDDAEMVELTESIKKVGLLEPLVVREKNGKFEVVCGIRRYRALGHINNGDKIPCNVVKVNDYQARILSFRENKDRADFSPIEYGRFYLDTLKTKHPKLRMFPSKESKEVKELADEVNDSKWTIANRIYLLALPETIQNMVETKVEDGGLLIGVAELISRLRQIDDKEFREKKMIQFAKDYSGEKPNIERLHDEINVIIEKEKESREKDKEKRSQYEEEEISREENELNLGPRTRTIIKSSVSFTTLTVVA